MIYCIFIFYSIFVCLRPYLFIIIGDSKNISFKTSDNIKLFQNLFLFYSSCESFHLNRFSMVFSITIAIINTKIRKKTCFPIFLIFTIQIIMAAAMSKEEK